MNEHEAGEILSMNVTGLMTVRRAVPADAATVVEFNRLLALESGFDYHLTKPADPVELERLLGSPAG